MRHQNFNRGLRAYQQRRKAEKSQATLIAKAREAFPHADTLEIALALWHRAEQQRKRAERKARKAGEGQ